MYGFEFNKETLTMSPAETNAFFQCIISQDTVLLEKFWTYIAETYNLNYCTINKAPERTENGLFRFSAYRVPEHDCKEYEYQTEEGAWE